MLEAGAVVPGGASLMGLEWGGARICISSKIPGAAAAAAATKGSI